MLRKVGPQLAFAVLTLGLLAVGGGRIVQPLYPVLALAIALWLETRGVAAYVPFVLWLWTMTPFVRRVADLQAGWQDPSMILLTPYLITAWPAMKQFALMVMSPGQTTVMPGLALFVMPAIGVMIGLPLGFAASPPTALLETLNWLVPLGFGWYVAGSIDDLPNVERAAVRAFIATGFIIGAYGIYQFFAIPAWDAEWMRNSEMATIGRPEPYLVRVFSTMHSPGVVGFFLLVPLVLWLARPTFVALPTACVTMVSLVLSQVRTAWLGFTIATMLLILAMTARSRIRLVLLVAVGALCVGPLMSSPEVADVASNRFRTIFQPDDDVSAVSRWEGHLRAIEFIGTRPFGSGIGSVDQRIEDVISMRDSVIVATLVQFGIMGAGFYWVGLWLLFLNLWRYYRRAPNAEAFGLACAGLGLLGTFGFGVVTAGGSPGVLLWLVGGLAVARRRQAAVQWWRVMSTQRLAS